MEKRGPLPSGVRTRFEIIDYVPQAVKERTITIDFRDFGSEVELRSSLLKESASSTDLEQVILYHQVAEGIGAHEAAGISKQTISELLQSQEVSASESFELLCKLVAGIYWDAHFTVTDHALFKLNAQKSGTKQFELSVYPLKDSAVAETEARAWAAFYVGTALFSEQRLQWLQQSLDSARSATLLFQAAKELGRTLLLSGREIEAADCFWIQNWAAGYVDVLDFKVEAKHNVFMARIRSQKYEEAGYMVEELSDELLDPETEEASYVQAVLYQMKAELCLAVHNYRDCHTFALKSVQLLETLPAASTPQGRLKLGECLHSAWKNAKRALLSLGDLEGADKAHQLSRQSHFNITEMGVEHLSFTATIQLKRGQLKDAETTSIELLHSCSGVSDLKVKADAFILRNEIFSSLGDAEAAIACLKEADELYRLAEPHHKAEVTSMLGNAYYSSKQWSMAVKTYEQYLTSLTAMDDNFGPFSSGRISHTGQALTPIFRQMQMALLELQEAKRAVLWAERERARDLIYRMVDICLDDPSAFDSDDDAAWKMILSILDNAGSGTLFVLYTVYKDRIITYLLQVGRELELRAVDASSLEYCVQKFRNLMERKRRGPAVSECLQNLHRLLIQPWSETLEARQPERLVFIPNEKLSLVPFAALMDDEDMFLVQKYVISYAPSLRLYDLCSKRHKALLSPIGQHRVLVVGDPDGSLEFAQREAELVAEKFSKAGAREVRRFLQHAATRNDVLEGLGRCSWAHIASHGVVNEEFPQGGILVHDSGQAMEKLNARERAAEFREQFKKGNVLTGRQIQTSALHFFALAVVLSACDTGLGEVCSEGILGLCRTLHGSGVPAAVVSLWKVDDEAANELMDTLYTEVCNGVDVAAALQCAMKQMIDADDGGRFDVWEWAPFMVSGVNFAEA